MAFGEVVFFAVVIALSPFTLIPALFMQFTPQPRATSSAFLTGWVIGIVVPAVACAALASVVQRPAEGHGWVAWARVVLGSLLILFGLRQWLTRHGRPAPAWMRLLSDASPSRAFRLGLLLSLANPKILLLSAAAGLTVGAAGAATTSGVTALAVFTVCAASTVALPVVLHLLMGERVLIPLMRVRQWLERQAAGVMAVVIAAIGVLVLFEGVVRL
ncbi:GAP family protein [Streptomyces sp. HNM0645]|uniref:GAP family protein n=1 Tax=Streptomyces sp. HNM0645 TaxID=2782343 RepID=UPI0024B7AD39|nr:GAP family protein [Streptomyces sp. HNM0645]MDI9888925.1 GAP family protein [Streptomyces sp. HNM0645]